MSQTSPSPGRPAQVTVAAWMIMVGSIFVVLMVWERIAGLHTLQSRQSLESVIHDPHYQALGLRLTELEALVKVISMVGAGCATAMVILGWHALQRSRGARLALTILAGPLFLCGLVTGGFVAAIVAAAVGTLWWGPARLWYDGRSAATHPSVRGDGTSAGAPGRPDIFRAPPPTPPPTPPAALPPDRPPAVPLEWRPPPTTPYPIDPATAALRRPVRTAVRRGPRPAAVLWACLVTWLFSTLAVLMLVAAVAVLATSSDSFLAKVHQQNPELDSQGLNDHTILVLSYVMCAMFVLWSAAAGVTAAFVFRGTVWAWYLLIISTVAVVGFCLLAAITSLLMLVPLGAGVLTLALLLRPESRAWFGR